MCLKGFGRSAVIRLKQACKTRKKKAASIHVDDRSGPTHHYLCMLCSDGILLNKVTCLVERIVYIN